MNHKKQSPQPGKSKQSHFNITQAISILQRKHYGCLSKVFCCKCFYCCQVTFLLYPQDFDFTLLTSKHRKGAFQQMVKKYLKSMHSSIQKKTNVIMDPFFILVALLLGEESQIYNQLLSQVSNANETTIFSKEDLQFYIPQLCTYLVFHEEMSNAELSTFLERACKVDLHFSLRYYFFMKSLQMIESTFEIKKLPIVEKYNTVFRNKINLCHKSKDMAKEKRRSLEESRVSNVSCSNSFESQKETQQNNSVNKFKEAINEQKTDMENSRAKRYRKDSSSSDGYTESNDDDEQQIKNELQMFREYNNNGKVFGYIEKPKQLQINQIYTPCLKKSTDHYPLGLFESTANFFFDLVELSELLLKVQGDRGKQFQNWLAQINAKLPALVYIPFTNNDYQGLNVVNIVIKESRVFKTKERAPFKVCFQTFYNPNKNDYSLRQKKIRSTMRGSKNLKRSVLFEQDIRLEIEGQKEPSDKVSSQTLENKSNTGLRQSQAKALRDSAQSTMGISESGPKKQMNFKQIKKNIWGKLFQLKNLIKEEQTTRDTKSQHSKDSKSVNSSQEKNTSKMQEENVTQNQSSFMENQTRKDDKQQKTMINEMTMNYEVSETYEQKDEQRIFGHSQIERFDEIAENSPYSRLPGYKIISLVVKSHDDLRQECFAMQLLYEFQRIFVMEKLKIKLNPYEVMPLSHNSGIIEFVHEAITIDELIKKEGSLKFVRKSQSKLNNFVYSLAGYSLVTYMLQVKDRHNQNIMIKRDGTIVHIDYGFFLSNMPGKGVELEKKVPFKLTIEYIEALGGLNSKQFAYFRKLFYQGFNALRKHQHRILILTKLMYSSYGTTMKCFEKGDQAIQKLVSRFNPKNVRTDGELSLFCQNLVNESIENWRAKWYDRWQYFAQGIVY